MSATALLLRLGAWLFATTLKGSVVIVLVALAQLAVGRRVQARWRHALWLLVVVRLLLPVAPASRWSLFNLLPVASGAPVAVRFDGPLPPARIAAALPGIAEADVAFYRLPSPLPILRALLVVWIGGALLLALRLTIASLRLRRSVRRARRQGAGSAALDALLRDAVRRFGDGGRGAMARMRIVESEIVRTPALHGLVRPTLLLPRGMAAAFTAEELRHVVLHELWHVRRLDVAVHWLLSAVETIHWFNPFVWFAAARIREERELACDERTLSCLEEEERFRYGTTILKLLERFRAAAPVPALVGIVDHKQKMKRRLLMITSYQRGRRFSAAFVALLAVITLAGFTDARGGERRFFHKLDPASIATMESLHQRVSVDLTSATLSELLGAVGASAHVSITQAPELATDALQQARFTLKAENVPAHAILMESLAPFGVMVEPSANGALVTKAPHGELGHEAMMLEHHAAAAGAGQPGGRVIIIDETRHAKGDEPAMEMEHLRHAEGPGQHEVRIRHNATGDAKLGADGRLHRELTLDIDEDGVQSQGKLSLDITAPPPVH